MPHYLQCEKIMGSLLHSFKTICKIPSYIGIKLFIVIKQKINKIDF